MDDDIRELLTLPPSSKQFDKFEDLFDRIALANYAAVGYHTRSDWRRCHQPQRSSYKMWCQQVKTDKAGNQTMCSWRAHGVQANGKWTFRSLKEDCRDHSHKAIQPQKPTCGRVLKAANDNNIDFWSDDTDSEGHEGGNDEGEEADEEEDESEEEKEVVSSEGNHLPEAGARRILRSHTAGDQQAEDNQPIRHQYDDDAQTPEQQNVTEGAQNGRTGLKRSQSYENGAATPPERVRVRIHRDNTPRQAKRRREEEEEGAASVTKKRKDDKANILVLDDSDDEAVRDVKPQIQVSCLTRFLRSCDGYFKLSEYEEFFRGGKIGVKTKGALVQLARMDLSRLVRTTEENVGLGAAMLLEEGLKRELKK